MNIAAGARMSKVEIVVSVLLCHPTEPTARSIPTPTNEKFPLPALPRRPLSPKYILAHARALCDFVYCFHVWLRSLSQLTQIMGNAVVAMK